MARRIFLLLDLIAGAAISILVMGQWLIEQMPDAERYEGRWGPGCSKRFNWFWSYDCDASLLGRLTEVLAEASQAIGFGMILPILVASGVAQGSLWQLIPILLLGLLAWLPILWLAGRFIRFLKPIVNSADADGCVE